MIWGLENGSSLTFAGTQSSNMSDKGAMNNNKEVFIVFVKLLEPHQTKFEPLRTPLKHNISFIFLIPEKRALSDEKDKAVDILE